MSIGKPGSLKSDAGTPVEIGIVLLNWNGWRDTVKCLESLEKLTYKETQIIVVDNASTDGSVAEIRKKYPLLEIVESAENVGFGAGNNIGIKLLLERGCSYIWLLNTDAVVEEETLAELVAVAESDSRIAATGSVIFDMDSDRRVQAWGGAKLNLWTGMFWHFQSRVPAERLDYLVGASMLCRADAFKRAGLFDEGFFLTWEDADLCFRFRKADMILAVADKSYIWHRKSSSTGGTSAASDRWFYPSAARFFRKHAPFPLLPFSVWISAAVIRRLLTLRFREAAIVLSAVPGFFRSL